jgi:hypothetical protein
MPFFLNLISHHEKWKLSSFLRYKPPAMTIKPNAPRTPLMPRFLPDVAELVCKLAVAVLVEVSPFPPAVWAISAGTTVMLVTVLTPPFGKVVVYMVCWVTERGVSVVLAFSVEDVDFTCNSEDEDGDWGEEAELVEGERVDEEDAGGGATPEV